MQPLSSIRRPASGESSFLSCFCRISPWSLAFGLLVLLFSPQAQAQTRLWDQVLGGNRDEDLRALVQTQDGGFLLGGSSVSDRGGDKSQDTWGNCVADPFDPQTLHCPSDFWIVKTDTAGNRQWDRTFGGFGEDNLTALQQTPDGGYLLGGTTASARGGDKSQDSLGGQDFWIIRLDAAGNKLWDRTFGGALDDALTSITLTTDGGFLLGGNSNSGIGGDKTEANKASCSPGKICSPDYWVLRIDAQGNKLWDKTYGGRSPEDLAALHQTPDGGFILGGYSSSGIGGNKSARKQGRADYWVVKLDAAGNKQWDKSFGSAGRELLKDLQLTRDGGYVLGGYVSQGLSGDISGRHHGDSDYWVLKLDNQGNKEWDKVFGGHDPDYFSRLHQTRDGGYLLLGTSFSIIGDDKTWQGHGGWVLKLDAQGNKQWDKIFTGSSFGSFTALVETRDGNYLLGASSASARGRDKSQPSKGGRDFWILKISAGTAPVSLAFQSFSPRAGLVGSMVIIKGKNLYKTASVWFHGAKLKKAKFSIRDSTTMIAWVPQPAKTGPITIFTVEGAVVSKMIFEVLHPRLDSFSPREGLAGTVVRLKGRNLITTREIYFNGVQALNFKVASNQEIIALVPAGATTGRVSLLLANGETVVSGKNFVVLAARDLAGARQDLSLPPTAKAQQPVVGAGEELPPTSVFPNPFRQGVTFRFTLQQTQAATVKVYDLLGREVQVLFQGKARAGEAYQAVWQPAAPQPAGLYYIRLQAGGQISQQKVLLDK